MEQSISAGRKANRTECYRGRARACSPQSSTPRRQGSSLDAAGLPGRPCLPLWALDRGQDLPSQHECRHLQLCTTPGLSCPHPRLMNGPRVQNSSFGTKYRLTTPGTFLGSLLWFRVGDYLWLSPWVKVCGRNVHDASRTQSPLCEAAVRGSGNVAVTLLFFIYIVRDRNRYTNPAARADLEALLSLRVLTWGPCHPASSTLAHDCVPSVVTPSSCPSALNVGCEKS